MGTEPYEYGFKKRSKINQDAIKGEKLTGFEQRVVNGVDLGPFDCGNCKYFGKSSDDIDSCGQDEMMQRSKRPRTKDGRVIVGSRDCCEFVERKGPKQPKKDQ